MTRRSTSRDVWWRSGVVYQVYPRSYRDSNGDGVGDLNGIRSRLDHLAWLGVDALWLSPVFPSPMRDFGYDVSEYCGIDPLFGTLDDFDDLVEAAHDRSVRIVLDIVPNHTSDEHPWFFASRGARESPQRDLYIWRPARADGSPPNNWRGVDGLDRPGSAWRFDECTQEYYYASYSPFQPDLNWANPEVRAAMSAVLEFWLERGVDGFRIDMVDFIGKDPALRDEPPETAAAGDYLAAAVHQLGRPETHDYLRELRRAVERYPERALIGEVLYFLTPQQLDRFYGDGDELDLPFHFGLMFLPLRADAIRAAVDRYDATLRPANWPNYNLANHDMPRLARYGPANRTASMLLLTLRGTPFIYYGDEIGMETVDVPPERRRDPFVIYQTGTGRDGSRTPMQWTGERFVGFSEVEPWLPVGSDRASANVAAQREDTTSMLWLHKRLLDLRRALPALHAGAYRSLDVAPSECFVYTRTHPDGDALVALNFGADEVELALPRDAPRARVLSTRLDGGDVSATTLTLRPHEGVVMW